MIVIFHHPADRNVKVKLIQHLQSHIDLTFSSVHQDQIRKHGKFAELGILLAFPETMSKSSGENLSQASVIVSSLDSLDLKFPVVISLRFSALIYNHRADRFKSVCIGNVVCLHPCYAVNSQQGSNLLHSPDRPSLLALQPFFVLGKYKSGILGGKFDKFLFRSFPGYPESYFLSPLCRKPGLQKLPFLHVFLQHKFSRDIRCSRIVLFNKIIQDATLLFAFCNPEIKMISPDQPSSADKEHLYHCVLFS